MKNTTLFNHLITEYERLAYTHNYIMGFEYDGVIYASYLIGSDLPYVCTLDKASRGQGYSLRFKPTKAQKQYMLMSAEVVCSSYAFASMVAESKYNKGEIFEKLMTEKFGLEWEKDNIPFTESGDINLENISYQVKFEKATFINEKTLARLA